MKHRYLENHVIEDLQEKMVFVGGPRQVGKTTLATDLIAARFEKSAYFNWDNRADRKAVRAAQWPGDAQLLIFDEIYKLRGWKRFIKGEYDKLKSKYRFLVTGSARMDVYRQGGDSLQGRYHHYRLHPFSLAEMRAKTNVPEPGRELLLESDGAAVDLRDLETFGGFPEPLTRQSPRGLRRWHNQKIDRLFREDIRDTRAIRDLDSMRLLSDMLPDRIGSPLSVNALREDLSVSHHTVSNWLSILESFHYHFRVYPHARGAFRAVKKEAKLYLWDWSEVAQPGARFENLIASHLLKLEHFLRDHGGFKAQLRFLRDRSGREVDFLMTVDEKPWFAVEAKMSDASPSPAIGYFKERLNIPYSYQVVRAPGVDKLAQGIRIVSADRFLSALI